MASSDNANTADVAGDRRLLTLASGGWVIITSIIFVLIVIGWQAVGILGSMGSRAIGDGFDPETYQFDLTTFEGDRALLTGSGKRKNEMRVLIDPATIDIDWVIEENKARKFLVGPDPVIGVEFGGEARCYPLLVLNWHEIVNDVVGGEPILVTWHPWTGTVSVHSRKVGDEVLDFGFSGLVYNSAMVLHDRREMPEGEGATNPESLWLPMQSRALAGTAAAAGQKLTLLPCELTTWASWSERHPDTLTLDPRGPYQKRNYKSAPYAPYYNADHRLEYADKTAPLPPEEGRKWKSRLLVVPAGGKKIAYPLDWLAEKAGPDGSWSTKQGDAELTFKVLSDPLAVTVTDASGRLPCQYVFWFAWHAMTGGKPALVE